MGNLNTDRTLYGFKIVKLFILFFLSIQPIILIVECFKDGQGDSRP